MTILVGPIRPVGWTPPIDPTKEPAEVEEDAACSFFDTFDQAQDFLAEYPELAEIIDPDFDGTACEDYFDVESD